MCERQRAQRASRARRPLGSGARRILNRAAAPLRGSRSRARVAVTAQSRALFIDLMIPPLRCVAGRFDWNAFSPPPFSLVRAPASLAPLLLPSSRLPSPSSSPPPQLNMLGHDMNWAAFHIIEVMSQERFGLKRIGFLAASQSFSATTDVIVLCTQLLKKEFMAKSPFEIGLAVNTLANIATEDLARDLLSDVVAMLTSSRTYIRKKATLVL
jgi:hypothetical protein